MIKRKVDTCLVCGDPHVEIVSRGRCAKCVMRERREAERRGEPTHNPVEHTFLRELNSYMQRFVQAAKALEDDAIPETYLPVDRLQSIRRWLREAIESVQKAKMASEHKSAVHYDNFTPRELSTLAQPYEPDFDPLESSNHHSAETSAPERDLAEGEDS
jgi:hypothetical protein